MKKAILVVSFGTTYTENCERTIGAIERAIEKKFTDYDIYRAFTSGIVRNTLALRDKLYVDSVTEAMDRLVENHYQEIVIQPTHVMNGLEYEDMRRQIVPYTIHKIDIKIGTPLLTDTKDYQKLVQIFKNEIQQNTEKDTAIVFMGHGTTHFANSTYAALDYQMKHDGFTNGFVGTVESYPDIYTVNNDLIKHGAKKVILYPLMIVAGDHAHNDMAGSDEDSWIKILSRHFEVSYVMKGLGEYPAIQNMFVEHILDCCNS